MVLGQDCAKAAATAPPKPLPKSLVQQARSADANPCSKLSYGLGASPARGGPAGAG